MKIYREISYLENALPSQVLDLYLPDSKQFPVFIYLHGGGLEAGSRADCSFYTALAEKGIAVVTADYRMYPTAKFPDFIEDAAAVVAWTQKNMPAYGEVTNLFVGGSSAGGYLSMMLCFDKSYLAAYGIDADALGGYIHDAGQPTTHFNVLRERGLDTRRVIIDEAAPLYHITENRSYAPMQIIVSEFDMENRPEQTHLLVSTLKHFGYEPEKLDFRFVKGSNHCAYVNARDDSGTWIFADMVHEFIAKTDKGWIKK
ncbi:MAG: alpha/beta hydrolase [Ruminococcaceae bacterium]|nr:alpha/beta hydrolase [Oscillospiraceae bacterium]